MSKKSPIRADPGSQHSFFSFLTSRAGSGIMYSVAATCNTELLYGGYLFLRTVHSCLQNFQASVLDPNRLCSDPDPDPASHVHLDPDPAPGSDQDPNKFGSGSNLNFSYFLKNQC